MAFRGLLGRQNTLPAGRSSPRSRMRRTSRFLRAYAKRIADASKCSAPELAHLIESGATVAPFSNRVAVLPGARLQTAQPCHPATSGALTQVTQFHRLNGPDGRAKAVLEQKS